MNTTLSNYIADSHAAGLSKVKELTECLERAISERIDQSNPDELTGKLGELASLQSTATFALAMSEQLYAEKIAELVEMPAYSKLSATDKKMLFAGLAKHEAYYVTMNERLSKNLSYSIESMRSILSYKKSEMENSRYQPT